MTHRETHKALSVVAALASCDVRTAHRYLILGATVRPLVARRIASVLSTNPGLATLVDTARAGLARTTAPAEAQAA